MEKRYFTLSLILITLISVIRTAEAAERNSVASIRPDSYCTSTHPYPGESRRSCVYINTSAIQNRNAGIQNLSMPLMEGVTVIAKLDRFKNLPSRDYSATWQGFSNAGSLTRLHLSGSKSVVINAEFWHQGRRYRIEPAGRDHRVIEFLGNGAEDFSFSNDAGIYVTTDAGTQQMDLREGLIHKAGVQQELRDALTFDPRGDYAIGTGDTGVTYFGFDANNALTLRGSFSGDARNAKNQVAMLQGGDYAVVNQGSAYGLYRFDPVKATLHRVAAKSWYKGMQGAQIVAAPNSRDVYVATAAASSILHYQLQSGSLIFKGAYQAADMRDVQALTISTSGRFIHAADLDGAVHGFAIDAHNGALVETQGTPYVFGGMQIIDLDNGVDGWSLLAIDSNANQLVSLERDSNTGALSFDGRTVAPLRHEGNTLAVDTTNRLVHVGTAQGWLESFSVRADASLRWKAVVKTAGPVNQIGLINY